jgi:putative FmdB family regulatory protein
MPVYEFYCSDCHMIFNFLSQRVNTVTRPDCPRCGRHELDRRVSRFAFSRGNREEPVEGLPEGLDEEKLERAMQGLAGEMEGVDENDPRQMARFMRRLTEATGIDMGGGMEEALRRLERGEDPEQIEQEMGDLLEGDNLFGKEGIKGLKRRLAAPAHDETLYRL